MKPNPESEVVKIENLEKRYQGTDGFALKGLNLAIRRQEIFGLLGPNGSGKTTTLSIICGIRKPDKGTVQLFGQDIKTGINAIKALMGYVPQEIALYPKLTLQENLKYFASLHGLSGNKLKERIEFCLKVARLENHAKKRIDSFSGGMKRRSNLVVGIIHNPSLLLLDEPTVGVDPQSKNAIFEALNALRENGMTMIYTTHYMEEVETLCDSIGIMDNGKMIIQGHASDLIRQTPDCTNIGEVFLALTGKQLRDESDS
ncbi:ABC transporter ATP-binding protein [bacterium]|nr:ABC transporter ATP-binding protein [bacterium]